MKSLCAIIVLAFSHSLLSQGPILTPLIGNPALKNARIQTSKRQITDTLRLPFMDDFTSTDVFPDTRLWVDKQVYVNNNFPVSPPSYGVATFDNLNEKGAPYEQLNGLNHNHCDSLTSNYINLKFYKSGTNNIDYKIEDSIYLSFFYQTQGLGDPLDNTDSLVLKFKDVNGQWNTVWKVSGSKLIPFKQVFVPVLNPIYLHDNFQMRFINYGKMTGNMNQWHLDYLRMNSSRTWTDTFVRDVAINGRPDGPLSVYNSMPYDHFKVNPAFFSFGNHSVQVRNDNTDIGVNTGFSYELRNQYNQLLFKLPFGPVNFNIPNNSDFIQSFPKNTIDTLSGKKPILRYKYIISPQTNDNTAGLYNNVADNNVYEQVTKFDNYLAFDDGTAEGGYGLDYGSLPSGPGYAAVKFYLVKADTLRGVSIFFNRSVADVAFKSFNLMVWQRISEPPANNDDNDIVLKKVNLATAIYTDSINKFVDIVFDTAVAVASGDLYIGWEQNVNFMLNIGYDNNYKYLHSGGRNPNLFYNLNGYWESVNSTITGAPMIRALVGAPLPKQPTSVKKIVELPMRFSVYPNPVAQNHLLDIQSKETIVKVLIMDINGRVLRSLESESISSLSIDGLSQGVYFIVAEDSRGRKSTQKFIIN